MREPRRSLGARAAVGVAGGSLLVAGVAGLFLPVVPGVVLIASGLAVLAREYHWARRTLTKLTPRRAQRSSDGNEAEAA